MADPLQNAAFLAQLFRPVSEIPRGFAENNARAEQTRAQERLRQIKRQQDMQDQEQDFMYRQALTNLQIAGQERIASEQTDRMIAAQNAATDRAIKVQDEMSKRAADESFRRDLSEARRAYRTLGGTEDPPKGDNQFKLDWFNDRIAEKSEESAKSAALTVRRAQRALQDEYKRITQVTDKDERTLVTRGLQSIENKDALEAIATDKMSKGLSTRKDVESFLRNYPMALREFQAGYDAASEGLLATRAKNSKISALQDDLQARTTLIARNPRAQHYLITADPNEDLGDPYVPKEQPKQIDQESLLNLGNKPKGETFTPAPAADPDAGYGGLRALRREVSGAPANAMDYARITLAPVIEPFRSAADYVIGGTRQRDEGRQERTREMLQILDSLRARNATPATR